MFKQMTDISGFIESVPFEDLFNVDRSSQDEEIVLIKGESAVKIGHGNESAGYTLFVSDGRFAQTNIYFPPRSYVDFIMAHKSKEEIEAEWGNVAVPLAERFVIGKLLAAGYLRDFFGLFGRDADRGLDDHCHGLESAVISASPLVVFGYYPARIPDLNIKVLGKEISVNPTQHGTYDPLGDKTRQHYLEFSPKGLQVFMGEFMIRKHLMEENVEIKLKY